VDGGRFVGERGSNDGNKEFEAFLECPVVEKVRLRGGVLGVTNVVSLSFNVERSRMVSMSLGDSSIR
jgi:hypothetical protein